MGETEPVVTDLDRDSAMTGAEADAIDVTLAASGDGQAFERLYRAHSARIHSLARRMLSFDEADEATQDVFVRAWEKLGSFRGEAAFGTWLHRLAINVMLGRRQAGAKSGKRFVDGDAIERTPSPRSHADFHVDFERAIVHLPDGARQVFVLHDVEGFKHHEIAELLGVTVGTSKAQLHRARMSLRGHLDR